MDDGSLVVDWRILLPFVVFDELLAEFDGICGYLSGKITLHFYSRTVELGLRISQFYVTHVVTFFFSSLKISLI